MATIYELKRKLREADETLRVARSDAERQRWTLVVQECREAIKMTSRIGDAVGAQKVRLLVGWIRIFVRF
jgi:hypothetical protein